MARITKTEMNIELLQLRTLCANYAHVDKCNRREIMRLKSRVIELSAEINALNIESALQRVSSREACDLNDHKAPRTMNQVHNFSARAVEYCTINRCNSVPPSVVAQWRTE